MMGRMLRGIRERAEAERQCEDHLLRRPIQEVVRSC